MLGWGGNVAWLERGRGVGKRSKRERGWCERTRKRRIIHFTGL